MSRQVFLCDPSDVQWLLEHVLTPANVDQPVPPFESFMLAGREDRPDRLDLFDEQEPRYYALPIAVYYLIPFTGRYTTSLPITRHYVAWDTDTKMEAGEYGPYSERTIAENVAANWPVSLRKNVRVETR